MDVADTCGKHCNAEVCDHLAFVGICTFACAHNAVFFAADSADFCFERDALFACDLNEFLSLLNVFFDGVVRTVKHYRRETCFNTSKSALVRAVVKVKSNGNSDAESFEHAVNHADNCLVAAHVFACAFGNTEDNRGVELLCCLKNSLCPLEVVDVELTNSVVAFLCFGKHFLC